MKVLSFASLAAIATVLSVSAGVAAEVPNVIGTWKVAGDRATARVGTSPGHARAEDSVSTKLDQAWNVEIKGQDGRSFYGVVGGPTGKQQTMVGVFRTDGKRFLISTDNGTGDGEMNGDSFELCWSDTLPTLVAVDCAIYRK